MPSIITVAGETLIAQKAQANEKLDIDTFIFANVPGQDPSVVIDRNETVPILEQQVHAQPVQQVGRINDNVVIYSTVLSSGTGPFDFNWVGLYSSINGTLVAINHIPTTPKTKTELGEAGNTLNRNFGLEYSGIAELTDINVAPETWQLDFTARLSGMDELTRQLASDMNGRDWFIDDGFKVIPRETENTFDVLSGVSYINGLRIEQKENHILTLESYPQFVYVDAYFVGEASSIWKPKHSFTVTDTEKNDYIDLNGNQHYVFKVATVHSVNNVEDLRSIEGLPEKINNHIKSTNAHDANSIGTYNGRTLEDFINVVQKNNDRPFLEASFGQSNGRGANADGPNPTNELVKVWDGEVNAFGSSDITKLPMTRTNQHGNGGNNNIAIAHGHRVQDDTGRDVCIVYDAVGGKKIEEWVGNGVESVRYVAIKNKIELALASPELAGVNFVDVIHFQQGEANGPTDTFQEYLDSLTVLVGQLRAESWCEKTTPILIGAPSELHKRYAPEKAMKYFCDNVDPYCTFVPSAGLKTSDNTHYTGESLWEMGYNRLNQAVKSTPNLNVSYPPIFYGRGDGPAMPGDSTYIFAGSSFISADSKTNSFPPNGVAATGSISFGYLCGADGNYSYSFGYLCKTHNSASYSFNVGREVEATELGLYSFGSGYKNILNAEKTFATGEGHKVSDECGFAAGSFSKYTETQEDKVIGQLGIGSSDSVRKNAYTARESGTFEIYVPSTANEPSQKEEIVFRRVSNQILDVLLKGTDGVVRKASLTLT